jgi:hypothetical protein
MVRSFLARWAAAEREMFPVEAAAAGAVAP